MSKLAFFQNKSIGLGVEIEIQLIEPKTGDLKPVGPLILGSLHGRQEPVHVKSEIFQSMLEIDTPVCDNAFQVGKSIRESLEIVRAAAAHCEADVMMAGTHPFAHYSERLLTPSSRYHALVDRNKWIARRLQIFGLHIHLGMRSSDHAIAVNNALCHYLPIFLAISASSPYWHREDTGLASSRVTFFEAIPTGGHPYLLNCWREFEELIERLVFSKSIESIKDLWWDIRPNLEFGTIEVRIADCPPTTKEVEALVALIHALTLYIDHEIGKGRIFPPPPEWILRENKWRASRHGVQCELITDLRGNSAPFLEIWQQLRGLLQPVCDRLGYATFMDFLNIVIAMGPSYARQRAHFHGDFASIVRHLIRESRLDQPEWTSTVPAT